jgi:hypothetical protein
LDRAPALTKGYRCSAATTRRVGLAVAAVSRYEGITELTGPAALIADEIVITDAVTGR